MKNLFKSRAPIAALLMSLPCAFSPQAFAAKAQVAADATQMVATRRLTESQYKHTIADIFGNDIVIKGRFEPERREDGLLAIGAGMLSISASGFEQYYAMAKGIADQVLDDKHRDKFVACGSTADEACTREFVKKYGRLLFRRPLSEEEITARVQLAASETASGKPIVGRKLALTSLLTAPQFLFLIESAEADPKAKGVLRLDGYSKAARLSYMLWDATPDAELMSAAESGQLHTADGVNKQVNRLLAGSNMEAGVRAFFSDMLQFDLVESVTKDASIYPKFSQDVAESAKEQTLRTLVDHLLVQNAPYPDVFTTRATSINRTLGSIYRVPFSSRGNWMPYTFPENAESAGVITQVTFLSVFSHPGRSSPTKRGAAIQEIFLCEPMPLPPANVDFSIVNDTNNPAMKTVRARLLAHAEDETCAGCHNKSDPLGLALERFDSLGQYRLTENGDAIDVSAKLNDKPFSGANGLGTILHDDPRAASCLVRNIYAYGVGRAPSLADKAYLQNVSDAFAKDGFKLRAALQRIATSPEFLAIAPVAAKSPEKTALNTSTK